MKHNSIEDITVTNVRFMPVIKQYAKRLRLVETINAMVDSEMLLQPGITVLAMVMDTLTGRSPLYRLSESFENTDTALLLGENLNPGIFSDYNVGRVLDRIYDAGSQKVFCQLSQNAIGAFGLNVNVAHWDTTSFSVFGDYDLADPPVGVHINPPLFC